jgi:hypothetical protein
MRPEDTSSHNTAKILADRARRFQQADHILLPRLERGLDGPSQRGTARGHELGQVPQQTPAHAVLGHHIRFEFHEMRVQPIQKPEVSARERCLARGAPVLGIRLYDRAAERLLCTSSPPSPYVQGRESQP